MRYSFDINNHPFCVSVSIDLDEITVNSCISVNKVAVHSFRYYRVLWYCEISKMVQIGKILVCGISAIFTLAKFSLFQESDIKMTEKSKIVF